MKKTHLIAIGASLGMFLLSLAAPRSASAHFGMVIPSDQVVMQGEKTNLKVDLRFWHPSDDIGMELVKPAKFGVVINDEETDLLDSLKSTKTKGHQTWTTNYKIKRPGIYTFYMEPRPYWEPAEGIYIIHYTKTVVSALGGEEGWDRELGLKTEIVPLSKPYGLYTCPDLKSFTKDNIFKGIVKLDGKPVPNVQVEIEYFNEDGRSAVSDYMCTHTKADSNGVFVYAVPKAGWWGFAALSTSDTKLTHKGEGKEVELGAVLWVRFEDVK
jgi:cobalt/nickel transport protein